MVMSLFDNDALAVISYAHKDNRLYFVLYTLLLLAFYTIFFRRTQRHGMRRNEYCCFFANRIPISILSALEVSQSDAHSLLRFCIHLATLFRLCVALAHLRSTVVIAFTCLASNSYAATCGSTLLLGRCSADAVPTRVQPDTAVLTQILFSAPRR